jgi:hypothetical protein
LHVDFGQDREFLTFKGVLRSENGVHETHAGVRGEKMHLRLLHRNIPTNRFSESPELTGRIPRQKLTSTVSAILANERTTRVDALMGCASPSPVNLADRDRRTASQLALPSVQPRCLRESAMCNEKLSVYAVKTIAGR